MPGNLRNRNPAMASNKILLEICCASVEDASIAESAGADRIELNTSLPLGGLTPSPGMVRLVLEQVAIPVIAMARPRESGFCYSGYEFKTLAHDVQWLVEAGVAGIAFGVLSDSGQVDTDRCREIVQLIGPDQQAVFHRAFDLIVDQSAALESLIECGITRVMTSGGKMTAWEGRDQIGQLVRQANNRIEILPAGGIRIDHASRLVSLTGVSQFHAGLGQSRFDKSYQASDGISFYGEMPENPARFRQSCGDSIRQMIESLH